MTSSVNLHRWQEVGAEWLAMRRHALLADEMRVGKTQTAIEAARLVGANRILVVCPAIARANWAREYGRPVTVITSGAQLERLGPDNRFVISSYDLIPGELAGPWDLVILDESHYLRTPSTTRAKKVLGRGGLVHRAGRVWALSGTPAVNHAGEMWTLMRAFGWYEGSYETFVREYCTGFLGAFGYQITGSKNHAGLVSLLKGHMLRRTLAEVAPELPAITFADYSLTGSFTPPEDERRAVDFALTGPDPDLALAALQPSVARLRRLAGEAKVMPAVELIVQELEFTTGKMVVFAVHRQVISDLATGLAKFRPAVVNGAVGAADRDKALRAFWHDPKCRVFIGNIQAAGTAIDLSVASEAVFVEASWVPGDNRQAAMRLQNLNQARPVTVRFLSLAGTVDERIQTVLRRKTRDLEGLFGA